MRRALLSGCAAAAAAVAAGCGAHASASSGTTTAASAAACARTAAAQIREDVLTSIARRVYLEEARGSVGHAAVKRIARDRSLLTALERSDPAALRAAALRQLFNPGKHVVRLRVVRGAHTLVDVGGAFVAAPARVVLRAPGGASLGTLEASIQDVVGFVKLVRRQTGADVVVRGRGGHVETSLRGAAKIALPAAGTVAIRGRRYAARSFREVGFAGEPLRIWVLSPAA